MSATVLLNCLFLLVCNAKTKASLEKTRQDVRISRETKKEAGLSALLDYEGLHSREKQKNEKVTSVASQSTIKIRVDVSARKALKEVLTILVDVQNLNVACINSEEN